MDGARDTRVAIMVDHEDWHARRLVKAFAARDREAVCLSLAACEFTVSAIDGLVLPGFDDRLPAGVFVRCVPGGSFEQVTRRLGVLHALDALGVPLCNGPAAIERCVDKSMTTFRLQRAGLPTPPTWACEGRDQAAALVATEASPARPLVLKPLFGSQGRGLRLIDQPDDLPPEEDVNGVYYLQRFLSSPGQGWRDWRVLVAGQRPVAAMVRHGTQWVTNMHQGAQAEGVALEPRMASLATRAVAAVGAGYGGVDLIRDGRGELFVLEVNSMPAWSGLQKVSAVDITQALVDNFLESLQSTERDFVDHASCRAIGH